MAEKYPAPWTAHDYPGYAVLRDAADVLCAQAADIETAGRIVAAVNAHDALVSACEQIVRGWGHQDGVSRAVEMARAALARARGKPRPLK